MQECHGVGAALGENVLQKNWLMEGGALQVPFLFLRLDQREGLVRGFGTDCETGIPLRRMLTARLFTGA